ncbi:hypothetical protein WJX73_000506 [Symbiochloris irregularis]|uniref:Uncharacterized protein n=1 Tax=Symbiochloris irregularis TaxID=706552 RepID=A0AAW1NMU1_9CHLO
MGAKWLRLLVFISVAGLLTSAAGDKAPPPEHNGPQPLAPPFQQLLNETTLNGAAQVGYWDAATAPEFAAAPSAPALNKTNSSQAGIEAGQITVLGKTISNGYQLPINKQGINDQRYFLSQGWTSKWTVERDARYKALVDQINPGVRRYNVFWHVIEGPVLLNTSTNVSKLVCPAGYLKYPANEDLRIKWGFNQFHCYNYGLINDLDDYLRRDASYGIESAAIMWGCPQMYRNPGCLGNPQLGKVPCAPSQEYLWAWDDFSALLTSRWQGGKQGRFTHFIIWNEADSSTWFDMSPEVNDTQQHIENTPQATVYVARYVAMMKGAHDSIARNLKGQPSMLYVSTDRMWTASPWCPGPRWGSRCPLGTVNLLNGIWKQVGTSFDWSVVVHAYGNPATTNWGLRQPYQAYTFADLPVLG